MRELNQQKARTFSEKLPIGTDAKKVSKEVFGKTNSFQNSNLQGNKFSCKITLDEEDDEVMTRR